ncbi:MAG: cupin domain-containing protein, partial [Planctomycetes bacterium]|nr:cupin domain-containing protein [Planctomycetota bacterium]
PAARAGPLALELGPWAASDPGDDPEAEGPRPREQGDLPEPLALDRGCGAFEAVWHADGSEDSVLIGALQRAFEALARSQSATGGWTGTDEAGPGTVTALIVRGLTLFDVTHRSSARGEALRAVAVRAVERLYEDPRLSAEMVALSALYEATEDRALLGVVACTVGGRRWLAVDDRWAAALVLGGSRPALEEASRTIDARLDGPVGVAQALDLAAALELVSPTPEQEARLWALAARLVDTQEEDGTWSRVAPDRAGDRPCDPTLATALNALLLGHVLSGGGCEDTLRPRRCDVVACRLARARRWGHPGRVTGAGAEAAIDALRAEGYRHAFEWRDGPGASHPPHTHAGDTAHVVLEGELAVTVDGVVRVHGPGARFDVPAGQVHAARAGPDGCRYVVGEREPR